MAFLDLNGLNYFKSKIINIINDAKIMYGECDTSGSTAQKTATITDFTLITDRYVAVKFANTNTAEQPTLNINNTGAKPLYEAGEAISPDTLLADNIYIFRYNGTEYDLIANSDFVGATSLASGAHGLVPAPQVGDADKFLKGDGTWAEVPVSTVTEVSVNIATTDWSSVSPYSYTYTNASISSTTILDIFYRDGAREALTSDLNFSKVTGGVQFTVDTLPRGNVPLTVRLISVCEIVPEKLDVNQGSANAGKFMVVDSSGAIVPMSIETWEGGVY